EQYGGIAWVGGDEREAIFRRGGAGDSVPLGADGFDEALHGPVGDGFGSSNLACNQQHPTLFVHPLSVLLFPAAAPGTFEFGARQTHHSIARYVSGLSEGGIVEDKSGLRSACRGAMSGEFSQ